MRRIIIFADGTWNTASNKDRDKIAPTNVFKLFVDAIPDICPNGDEQISYYHEGVGTGNWLDKQKGGFLGEGIDNNIKVLYKFIVEHYTVGTELFFFGFSRGSYTVRSLAGLIRNCGILKKYNTQKVDRAYFIYRSKNPRHDPSAGESVAFQTYFSYKLENTPIKFIGVWDTVGALGIPFKFFSFYKNKYRFHDVKLSGLVHNAYHAIAINENRVFFRHTLWQKQTGKEYEHQTLEQCWFRGVHSDVGGGYSNGNLSNIPLHYFVEKAKTLGLQTNLSYSKKDLQEIAINHPQNEEWKGIYSFFPRYYRIINAQVINGGFKYKLSKILFKLFIKNEELENYDNSNTYEVLHESVIDYYSSGKVKPINLDSALGSMPIIPY